MLCPDHKQSLQSAAIRRRGPWRSFEAVELRAFDWVDWFNMRRLLEPIGNSMPVESEHCSYAMLKQPALTA
jgi:hypothetical protein